MINGTLGWEKAVLLRRRIASPAPPLQVCHGNPNKTPYQIGVGYRWGDGCKLVYRGQQRIRSGQPYCPSCHAHATARKRTLAAERRAREAGVLPYLGSFPRVANPRRVREDWEEGTIWVGKCSSCGQQHQSRRPFTVCATCRRRGGSRVS
jgi:hypothetical protein